MIINWIILIQISVFTIVRGFFFLKLFNFSLKKLSFSVNYEENLIENVKNLKDFTETQNKINLLL